PARGTGLTALGNPGPAALEELGLPPRHRLLRDLVPPSGLGDRHLPGQHAQHDPDLVLHREHRATAHRHTSCSGTYITPEPQSLTHDTTNRSARHTPTTPGPVHTPTTTTSAEPVHTPTTAAVDRQPTHNPAAAAVDGEPNRTTAARSAGQRLRPATAAGQRLRAAV